MAPWTVSDVDSHHTGLSSSQKRQWVAVANSILKKCLENGGDESTCAASAIQQANGVVNNAETTIVNFNSRYSIRATTHQGKPYIIVPVVMMVEGVHNGSHGPLFHSATELGRFIQTWNGIPVVIQHPARNGESVSANSPDIIDSQTIGRVYNARMDGNKLCGEVWIDVEQGNNVSPETMAIIRSQERLDVSVGIFSEEEAIPGNWNGEDYVGIARNHRPDHLALLPGGVGACSWNDGCGIRANKEKGGELDVKKETGEEISSIKNEDLNKGGSVEDNEEDKKIGKLSLELNLDATKAKEDLSEFLKKVDVAKKSLITQGVFLIQADQGYRQIMSNIQEKLDRMDDDVKVHFLQEVFDNYFIYEVRGRMGGAYSGAGLYKRAYTVNINGSIEFSGEPTAVRREVQYIANNSEKGVTTMSEEKKPCCPGKVELLIQSEHTPYKETDKEFLSGLEEIQIDKLVDMEKVLATPKEEKKVEESVQITNEQAVQVLKENLKTPDQFFSLLPEDMREAMVSGYTLHQERRKELIDTITKNSDFTEDEIKGKSIAEITKMAKMVGVKVDYSGMNGGSPVVHTEIPVMFPGGFGEKEKGGK